LAAKTAVAYFRWWPYEVTYSCKWEEANHQKWHNISILPWQFPTYWRVWRQGRFI